MFSDCHFWCVYFYRILQHLSVSLKPRKEWDTQKMTPMCTDLAGAQEIRECPRSESFLLVVFLRSPGVTIQKERG